MTKITELFFLLFLFSKDQQKFFRIESLIGKDIPKLSLPESLGDGPIYQPEVKPKTSFKPKTGNGNWKGKR